MMPRTEATPRRRRLCCVIATVLWAAASVDARADAALSTAGPDAAAAPPPLQVTSPYVLPPSRTAEDATVPMVLSVSLNQTRQEELLNVQRHGDGSFSAMAGDLRRFRLRIDPSLADTAMVRLDSVPQLRVTYDEAGQELALEVADGALQAYEVSLGGMPERTDMRLLQSRPAAILNYDVTATHQGGNDSTYANIEALWTGRYGVASTTALYDDAAASTNARTSRAVRLDSTWRYVDPTRVRAWVVGDFTSNTLSWSNSVRLAGFQVASDFSQRADIVTAALPQFSGSAALPSTLDLYVNQQKVYSGDIPSGPYQLKSLPYLSGGDVTVVTTDASGHQTTTTQSFYYDASLLQRGVTQYSLDVGVPRFNYATRSSDYDDTVFGSGTYRHGLWRATTVEGAAQFSGDGLANVGGGFVQGLAGRGTLAVSGAASRYKGDHGSLASLALEGQVWDLRLYGSTQRTFGDYFDLARVSDARLLRRESTTASVLDSTAMASSIDRAGLSFTPWFDSTSVSLSYNRIRYTDGEATRYANLSLSRGLTRRVSVNASAYATLGGQSDHGFYVTFNVNLGRNLYAAAGVQRSNGQMAYTQQINGAGGARQNSTSWGLSSTENAGGPDQQNAYVSYLSRVARLSARYYGYGSSQRFEVEAGGSLIATTGSVFAANQIGDAYVVVKNAGPGAGILQGGVLMGQANSKGQLLLPNIQPYYQQQVYADPAGLPDGWELAQTEVTAVAGYRQGAVVDFGASRINGAVVILHDANGKPLAPGFTATLANGEHAVVGYDGQVYLRGLQASNHVSVDLGSAGTCVADFAYDPNGPVQPTLGPLTCQ